MGTQCTAKSKQSGERCKRLAIPGGNVCMIHGGNAPQVRKKADERLLAMVNPALDTLNSILNNDRVPPSDRLRAVKEVLDRAGVKQPEKSEVTIEISEPVDSLRERLERLAERRRDSND